MTEKLGPPERRHASNGHDSHSRLESSLGYRFRDRQLLRTALTPPSSGLAPNNQRLEFLGDTILQFCVSRLIFQEQPTWDEGAMSKLRGMIVCTESLREWALDLELGLEQGPRSLKKPSAGPSGKPLADAMEALLAAVYMDAAASEQDPMATLSEMINKRFMTSVRSAFPGLWETRDSKTTLQEKASASGLPAPVYELIEKTGPDHEPTFLVKVSVGPHDSSGRGSTLKRAQTDAARQLLERVPWGTLR